MKKIGIINAPISSVIAHLEHTDMFTVADAGLPVPATTQRIDLASQVFWRPLKLC